MLSSAVGLCQLRRLRRIAAAAPVPAAAIAIGIVVAPIALLRVGATVGSVIASSGSTEGSVALTLGPVLAAAVAGAVLALSLPGRDALGAQIAAGPVRARRIVGALVLVPALGLGLVLLPSLVATCVGVGRASAGGFWSGLALAGAVVAGIPAGAILAEGGLAATRGNARYGGAILAAATAWAAVGDALGAAALGPLAVVPQSLRGDSDGRLTSVGTWAVAGLIACVWLALAARRPAGLVRPSRRRRGIVARRGRISPPIALSLLLGRRGDVRLASVGALLFGLGGIALAVSADAPPPTPLLLGTSTALLGALLCPLAVGGLLLEGRWLWRGATVESWCIGGAAVLVGAAGAFVPVVLVGVVAAAASGEGGRMMGVIAALTLVGAALALVAGSVVPLRGGGAGDQLTTFAVFAAFAVAASLLIGLAGPRLVATGLPDPVVVLLVCAAATALAFGSVGLRINGAAR